MEAVNKVYTPLAEEPVATANDNTHDRAEKLLRPVSYIHSPEFEEPNVAECILAPLGERNRLPVGRPPKWTKRKAEPHIALLCQNSPIEHQTMRSMFRAMNFRKYRVKQWQDTLQGKDSAVDVARFTAVETDLSEA